MRVESVSFGQILRRCLPLPRLSSRPKQRPPSSPPPAPRARPQNGAKPPPTGGGKPSKEAEAAIADVLEKISQEAAEARKKK
jgi:hypothetical protein